MWTAAALECTFGGVIDRSSAVMPILGRWHWRPTIEMDWFFLPARKSAFDGKTVGGCARCVSLEHVSVPSLMAFLTASSKNSSRVSGETSARSAASA